MDLQVSLNHKAKYNQHSASSLSSLTFGTRCNLTELLDANSSKLLKNVSRISKDHLFHCGSNEEVDSNYEQYERGLHLMSEGKIAVVLVMDDKEDQENGSESVECPSNIFRLQKLFINDKKVTKVVHYFSLYLCFIVIRFFHLENMIR